MNDEEFDALLKRANLYDTFLEATKQSGQLLRNDWSDDMFNLAIRFFERNGCEFIDEEYRFINVDKFRKLLEDEQITRISN